MSGKGVLQSIARNMTSAELSSLRMKYKKRGQNFLESQIARKEPISLFRQWLDEAIANGDIIEPNGMCLSTVNSAGVPSSRMVLLKSVSDAGFTFFTNYGSHKASDIEANSNVALNLYWAATNRQIRVEGRATKLSREQSEEYFRQRPRASQIGAVASPQSQRIASRQALDAVEAKVKSQYGDTDDIPMPNWGGYLVEPNRIEFWQGQSDRLHDRIQFRRESTTTTTDASPSDSSFVHRGENGWVYERLAP